MAPRWISIGPWWGSGVDPDQLWLTLSAHVETLVVGDYPAQTLTIPGRAFHLALHAAQHGVEWDRVLADLERAVSAADEETWRAAPSLPPRCRRRRRSQPACA